MATPKNILEKIKLAGQLEELFAKSHGTLVTVTYNGSEVTLDQALAAIFTSVSGAQTSAQVQAAIKAEIDKITGGASTAYDTLGEIEAYINEHKEVADALNAAIGAKAEKDALEALQATVEGLGALAKKSTVAESDLDSALKTKIGNIHAHSNKTVLDGITDAKVKAWDAKAEKTEASESAAGLMSADDKKRINAIGGVFYGTTPPATMKDGDLFVHVVS